MSALKKALAIAAIPATMAAAPAGAEVLFDNTNTVGETPEYMGVAAYYPDLDAVGSSVFLFPMMDPAKPNGGIRVPFAYFASAPGLVQFSMIQVGSLGTETICDSDGVVCVDQPVYTLVPGTESDTKTINFMPGARDVTVDFDGYAVHGGTYAILFAGVPQDTPYSVSLQRSAPESIIGRYTGVFPSSPDLTTFYQKTDGIYTSDVGVAFKIETLPAVPEPEDYAMFLAGLGLVGLAARRRTDAAPSTGI